MIEWRTWVMEEKRAGHLFVYNIFHTWNGFMDCGHFKGTKVVRWCPPCNQEVSMDCGHSKVTKIVKWYLPQVLGWRRRTKILIAKAQSDISEKSFSRRRIWSSLIGDPMAGFQAARLQDCKSQIKLWGEEKSTVVLYIQNKNRSWNLI